MSRLDITKGIPHTTLKMWTSQQFLSIQLLILPKLKYEINFVYVICPTSFQGTHANYCIHDLIPHLLPLKLKI